MFIEQLLCPGCCTCPCSPRPPFHAENIGVTWVTCVCILVLGGNSLALCVMLLSVEMRTIVMLGRNRLYSIKCLAHSRHPVVAIIGNLSQVTQLESGSAELGAGSPAPKAHILSTTSHFLCANTMFCVIQNI